MDDGGGREGWSGQGLARLPGERVSDWWWKDGERRMRRGERGIVWWWGVVEWWPGERVSVWRLCQSAWIPEGAALCYGKPDVRCLHP